MPTNSAASVAAGAAGPLQLIADVASRPTIHAVDRVDLSPMGSVWAAMWEWADVRKRFGRSAIASLDIDDAVTDECARRADWFVWSSVPKVLLGTGVAVAVVVLGIMHRAAVDAGGDSLARADGEWLALAALATVAMWIAGTASLLGTLPVRPPLGRLFAV